MAITVGDMSTLFWYLPTCQVSVVGFYVSCPASSSGPEQQAQDQSDPRLTSAASARSQCSPPHPNSNLWSKVFATRPQLQAIAVFPAGPGQQAQDQSAPSQTSTASARSAVLPAGLKRLHSELENPPFWIGKSTISMAIFNSKLLNY